MWIAVQPHAAMTGRHGDRPLQKMVRHLYKVKKYCVSCEQSRMLEAKSRNFMRIKGEFYGMEF